MQKRTLTHWHNKGESLSNDDSTSLFIIDLSKVDVTASHRPPSTKRGLLDALTIIHKTDMEKTTTTGVNNAKSFNPANANRAGKRNNPLFEVGFVNNRETYVEELNQRLVGTGLTVNAAQIAELVKSRGFDNRNVHGYARESDGSPIELAKVMYRVINTGIKNSAGDEIVGWFTKAKQGFCGISWGTERDFIASAINSKKFSIGNLYFDEWSRGLSFLEGIAKDIIPETWGYQLSKSAMKHPILKSYIENILNRLIQEDKIVFSQDGKWVMFNTNLLDKFFHEVIVVA